MAITLTHVATGEVTTVTEVLGYYSSRDVPTVVHAIIGRGTPDFTVKPAGPRSGTYKLFCLNETVAVALCKTLTRAGQFVLADTATAIANTTFMVTGNLSLELDDQTRVRCIVSVEYTEVTA